MSDLFIASHDLELVIPKGLHCDWCSFHITAPHEKPFCLLFAEELDEQSQEKNETCYRLFAKGGVGCSEIGLYGCNLHIEPVR